MKNRVVRTNDDLWAAAQAKAQKEGTTVSAVIRRLLTAWVKMLVVVLAAVGLTACGAEEPASSPAAERTAPVVAAVPPTSSEALSAAERAAAGECVSLTLGGARGEALKDAFHDWSMIQDLDARVAAAPALSAMIPADSEGCEDGDRIDFQSYRDTIQVTVTGVPIG